MGIGTQQSLWVDKILAREGGYKPVIVTNAEGGVVAWLVTSSHRSPIWLNVYKGRVIESLETARRGDVKSTKNDVITHESQLSLKVTKVCEE